MIDQDHFRDIEDWWKTNTIDGMQGGKFTVADYEKFKGERNPKTKYVSLQELEARANHRRAVETSQDQQTLMADYDAYENMSDDDRGILGAEQHVKLVEAQLAKAKAQRQTLAIERYELKLEQVKAYADSLRQRQAALEVQRTQGLILQEEPAFRYALTSAESYELDYTDPDSTELGVYLERLKAATPDNWKDTVKDFHQWEAQRFARIATEKQAAEAAALQAADHAVRALNQAGVDAAQAGLDSAEALGRANRLRGPGDLQ